MMPKVADFGLSRFFDDNKTHTNATILTGSIGYMAPEYIYKHEITKKADIYSLGVIIIEIITGARIDPFNSTSYQESMESVRKSRLNLQDCNAFKHFNHSICLKLVF
ncbi:hypothetical protein PR202_ga17194 [Eleusine coracana subsp. coracana]|uniref:Protein kinase domain-containing protein n=1 Tax=Eleusine coracana subsp. coracana TaxID=191504 RepID=A0AAV5CPX9_ELECO|nr:hypothetical protein PR202_ga17194 [Eleusine coracana subsp. coracana]